MEINHDEDEANAMLYEMEGLGLPLFANINDCIRNTYGSDSQLLDALFTVIPSQLEVVSFILSIIKIHGVEFTHHNHQF